MQTPVPDGAGPARAVSFGVRVAELARRHPDADAIVWAGRSGGTRTVSWAELEAGSNRTARLLAGRGVGPGDRVVVALPNVPEHYLATLAAWKLGACVLPLRADLPSPELRGLLEIAEPAAVVGDLRVEVGRPAVVGAAELAASGDLAAGPLPDRVPEPGKGIASGGSTGRPKLVLDPRPWAFVPGEFVAAWSSVGIEPGMTQLVTGPLHHNSPFVWSTLGLFEDQRIVLMEKFDARRAVELIERYRVDFCITVPTVLHRIAALPDIAERDLSSLRSLVHTAAPCPPWLKRAWIDLIGPTRLYEAYGASEGVGRTVIRGDEWLAHPGSVGRPDGCDVRVVDENGDDVPAGEVGEIYMRPHGGAATYRYLGADPAPTDAAGFVSVGDLGSLDADGYLHIADRRADLIITGGANVYPAEVEAALTAHPGVADAVVVGIPDPDWGRRVHAVVEPARADTSVPDLDRHLRESLASYKVPKTYELIDRLPRDEAGKVRRSQLIADRTRATTAQERD